MKQILHIFAKDARHFWPESLISLLLLGVFVGIEPSTWSMRNGLYTVAGGSPLPVLLEAGFLREMLMLFIPVSWWLLIARVVHAEALVGDRQFWLTRPYEWKKLLAAKLLFLLVLLYLPLILVQCLLLLLAGFHPLPLIPGLLLNLVFTTGILVLPVFAIATVTSSFTRLTVTLLAILTIFIGYLTISLLFSDSASIPGNGLSFPLILAACGIVVVLQYATRRLRLARIVLIGLPVLLVLVGLVVPQSTAINRDYPGAHPEESGPFQLTLLQDPDHPPASYLHRGRQVQLTIPVQASGVAQGYAIIPDQVRVTVDAADGRHWTSPWQGAGNDHYLPGSNGPSNQSWITVTLDRQFFDQVKSAPVTLHLTFAVTQVREGEVRNIPLPAHEFSVPDFGICSPQEGPWSDGLSGISCRFALRPPRLTYLTVQWSDSHCPASTLAPATAVPGDAWVGNLDSSPADFGINPISIPQLAFSNATKNQGAKWEPRYLCSGTPVTFTQYDFVRRTQYDLNIPGFRLPNYRPSEVSLGASSFSFTVQ
jgi:hypothetical protein